MFADAAPLGFAYGLMVLAVWLLLLLVPALSVGMFAAGAFVFGPVAVLKRRTTHRWPAWSPRILAYSTVGAGIAAPGLWLLVPVAAQWAGVWELRRVSKPATPPRSFCEALAVRQQPCIRVWSLVYPFNSSPLPAVARRWDTAPREHRRSSAFWRVLGGVPHARTTSRHSRMAPFNPLNDGKSKKSKRMADTEVRIVQATSPPCRLGRRFA